LLAALEGRKLDRQRPASGMPQAFLRLLNGQNFGKQLVRLAAAE
jgi:NADPH-dependent curcumin reductase CurA